MARAGGLEASSRLWWLPRPVVVLPGFSAPEPAVLEEAWRRTVLGEFVRCGWLEADEAAGMLAWPHSGFGAYVGPRIEELEGVLRVARYSARAPVAEGRLLITRA